VFCTESFGANQPGHAKEGNEMMLRHWRTVLSLSSVCLSLAVEAGATAAASETTVDGQPAVVMENHFLRMVLRPDKGGACTDFVYKPSNQRFVSPRVGSLLGNRVWNYADRELYFQWQKAPWPYEIERRAGEVELVMRVAGTVDFTRSTPFEKRIVLRDGEAMARVRHTFFVGQELMTPRQIGLWFYNKVSVAGERFVCRFPLDDGIVTLDPATGGGASWFYNPSRGWVAVVGESGAGLCLNMEFRRLMCFHVGGQKTLEWAFRTTEIKHGESLSTEELLVPFAGLRSVQGGGGGVVAGFLGPEKCSAAEAGAGVALRAQLTSGTPQAGELVASVRRLPDGAETPLLRRELALKPGEVAELDATFTPPRDGTWLVVGRWVHDGREVMDFVHALVVGEASGPVRIEPKAARVGRVSERFEDRRPIAGAAPKDVSLSMAVESPHVKWARPYSRGRLKVLVLTSPHVGREAVEMAQRLDMEIIWVTAGNQYELGGIGPWFSEGKKGGRYSVAHMNQHLKTKLLQPCDAIIIGGLRGDLFTDEVLDLLRKKVEQGVGLVYVGPNRCTDKLYSFLPVEKEIRALSRGRGEPWRVTRPHPVTTGIPLAQLPPTRYTLCKATGEVLATLGKYPLIIVQEGPGQGRVVVFTYNTAYMGSGTYSYGLTPFFEKPDCRFKYWEHHFSLLAKALVWAARREPPVRLEAIEARLGSGGPEAVLTLDNPGDALTAKAEVSLADAFGRTEFAGASELSLAPGRQEIRLALHGEEGPRSLAGGLHLADVILRDSAGKVLTWGSAALDAPATVRIEKISFDQRAYHPGEVAKATVGLAGADGAPRDVLLRAEFRDGLGRIFARGEQRTTVGEKGEATFELPVGKPLVTAATLRIAAWLDGGPGAVGEGDVITLPERFSRRDWADWHSTVSGTHAGQYARDYLVPLKSKVLKECGVMTVRATARWLNQLEYERQVRAGFQIMPIGVAYGAISLGHTAPKGKMSFKEQKKNYDKTHDKKFLERPICLNSEADLASNAERLREIGEYCGWLGPIGYNLGDEMSTTHYVTAFDYDFRPEALAAFREWLREQYGSLAALNQEWDTSFASWAEVMPLTTFEVKGRGNYAPWADHRAFMDDSLAKFIRWTCDRLREGDPRATVGLSGSQAAEAYGGYNWWTLSHTLDFFVSYTHQNTGVMHRSFGPDVPRATAYAYAHNPGMRHRLWWLLLQGNFAGTNFTYRFLFYPDLTPTPSMAQSAEVVREFQGGVAKLLRNCARVSDIGIHYSHASIRGAFISGAATPFRVNRMGWIQAAEDLGFQCEFLARPQLESGELAKRGYRAFILPYSVAISAPEAEALRRYVEGGGLLIADAKTGLMDEHCKTLAKGRPDGVFGITRAKIDPMAASREGQARFTRDRDACKVSGLDLDLNVAEQALTLSPGAEALGAHGKTPIAIVRKVGKGTAVFLNFLFDSFPQRRELGIEQPMLRLAQNLLLLEGVEPTVRVRVEANPSPRMFTVHYTSGEALYVATLAPHEGKTADSSANVTVTFPKQGYVYDVRKGRALGLANSATTRLLAGDSAIYGILPHRISAVSVTPRAGTVAPGAPVQYDVAVRAEGGRAGMHVVLIEVVDPTGAARAHYGAKLLAREGKATGEFVPALNDPTGNWTIRATDYATRVAGSAQVALRP